jgi:hypothetical protein
LLNSKDLGNREETAQIHALAVVAAWMVHGPPNDRLRSCDWYINLYLGNIDLV